ncbi:hypothetical protein F5878DRAFT_643448 [Lentinula raphanica]|uniref:Uncharacterized protein n=1 Tax=Lentinula raphanica TaxID=153919 RepID=A0AA38UFU1_9AGAR|nr:hypothetical protein F5878DRAFT_643448 [Lentinula raphanica]
MFRRTLSLSLFRSIWLLLAVNYLHVALVDAFPLPSSPGVSQPGLLEPRASEDEIPLTVGIYKRADNAFRMWATYQYALTEHSDSYPLDSKFTYTPCFGSTCWIYKDDGPEGPRLEELILTHTKTKNPSQPDPYYFRGVQASISNPDSFRAWYDNLVQSPTTMLGKIKSELSKNRIDVDINDGRSLSSAAFRLLTKLELLKGYNEDQTIEQNLELVPRSSEWSSLRFGKSEVEIVQGNREADVWKPMVVKGVYKEPNSLYYGFWELGYVFKKPKSGTVQIVQIKPIVRGWYPGNPPSKDYFPRLNLQLDGFYAGQERRSTLSTFGNQVKDNLANVQFLKEQTGVEIVDFESLCHAHFRYLQHIHWLSLTPEELKKNLEKPPTNLIYREMSDKRTQKDKIQASHGYRPIASKPPGSSGAAGPSQLNPGASSDGQSRSSPPTTTSNTHRMTPDDDIPNKKSKMSSANILNKMSQEE